MDMNAIGSQMRTRAIVAELEEVWFKRYKVQMEITHQGSLIGDRGKMGDQRPHALDYILKQTTALL